MKQLEDQISALQQQVQNLTSGSTKGQVIPVEKPSFNCQCGVNSTVNFVFRGNFDFGFVHDDFYVLI